MFPPPSAPHRCLPRPLCGLLTFTLLGVSASWGASRAMADPRPVLFVEGNGPVLFCEEPQECDFNQADCPATTFCAAPAPGDDPGCYGTPEARLELFCCEKGSAGVDSCPLRGGVQGTCVSVVSSTVDIGLTEGVCFYPGRSGLCAAGASDVSAERIRACYSRDAGTGALHWPGGDCDGDGTLNGDDCAFCDAADAGSIAAGDCPDVPAPVPDPTTSADPVVDPAVDPPVGSDNRFVGPGLDFRGGGGCGVAALPAGLALPWAFLLAWLGLHRRRR